MWHGTAAISYNLITDTCTTAPLQHCSTADSVGMNINTKHTKRRWVPRCYFFFVNNELEIIFPSFPTSNSFKLVWSCLYPGCSVPVSGNISISYPISGNEWIWIFYIKALNFWEPNVFSTSLQPTDDNIHVIWEVGTRGRRKRVNQLETRAFYSKPDMKETFDDRETIISKGLVSVFSSFTYGRFERRQ